MGFPCRTNLTTGTPPIRFLFQFSRVLISKEVPLMSNCSNHSHEGHAHKHDSSCGHQSVLHDGHTDYLHDGHLHHVHGDHVDEHTLAVNPTNPDTCTPQHRCGGH